MEVLLLGTGAADGWPSPFCGCASCAAMRARGELRAATSALVDGVLLLDAGPDAPRAAERCGRPFTGLRHVLVTHAHPDHFAAPLLMWHGWLERPPPLDLVGPPAVIATAGDWIAPHDPVASVTVAAGDRLRVGPYDVRVLAAAHAGADVGPAVLYDVTGPDGARLLWGTDTGPLSAGTLAAVTGAAYDVVLLELTWGDVAEHGPDHHDAVTFGRTVAELRRREAVTERTRVLAVHLGHRNPPPPELDRRLAAWGAAAPPDGSVVHARPAAPPPAPRSAGPRRVLVLGGARSGKSAEAERRLAAESAVTYVATGPRPGDDDAEWAARVRAHRARRPTRWRTLETTDLARVLREEPGPLLVEDVGLWLTAALGDEESLPDRVEEVVQAWRDTSAYVVAVSNEVGGGVHPPTAIGRRFRDALGVLNARLAAAADEVWLVTAGIATQLR